MKVVLFCGGMGMRLREYSENIPKPMVNIGYRPVLWHVMKYYAHYGHKDFILCLGYKADVIKRYFVDYDETLSNDFILAEGGQHVELLNRDIQDWKITFVDTGLTSSIGERLKAVEPYLQDEESFMANYSDGLTDLPLPYLIDHFKRHDKIATFLCIKPTQSFHIVHIGDNDRVSSLEHVTKSELWMNGGFFVFKKEIFSYLHRGEELVYAPFRRLIEIDQLNAYKYDGFWTCMDTFKDKQLLDDQYDAGNAPWEVWKSVNGSMPEAEAGETHATD
jgi:glucose-1-phosphate cytidylyltransferase